MCYTIISLLMLIYSFCYSSLYFSLSFFIHLGIIIFYYSDYSIWSDNQQFQDQTIYLLIQAFMEKVDFKISLILSHRLPPYLCRHLHSIPTFVLMHFPPCWHGFPLAQWSSSIRMKFLYIWVVVMTSRSLSHPHEIS